jgi:hypothetical protein
MALAAASNLARSLQTFGFGAPFSVPEVPSTKPS